jgi:selenocysteine-specific elongation factor
LKTTTSCFDAAVEFRHPLKENSLRVLICTAETSVSASLLFYKTEPETGGKREFVHVQTAQPLSLKWKQAFEVKNPENSDAWGEGLVLDPIAGKFARSQVNRRLEYLNGLLGNEGNMLLSLIRFRGIHGVQEEEIIRFGHFSRSSLLAASQELEAEGQIRILEFSPLFVVSQDGIEFLCERILMFLSRFHEQHPSDIGIPAEKIQKRFDVHPLILTLALKHLTHDDQIKEKEDHVALSSFELALNPEEEKILDRLEDMFLKDKFHSLSLAELQKSFRFTSRRLNKMLSLLTERKKIVLSKDGFILHSRWLDEVIQQVRNSGKKELTVSDFKEMTGLTRKFAIPLLELLDQMGVTKRRGSTHEIL